MAGAIAKEQTWVVSAADVSCEEGAVIGVAYDGESFPAMLSFYTEASGDECVISSLTLSPKSPPSASPSPSPAEDTTDTPRSVHYRPAKTISGVRGDVRALVSVAGGSEVIFGFVEGGWSLKPPSGYGEVMAERRLM